MNPFSGIEFHPVIKLPKEYDVYDLTVGYDPNRKLEREYGIGKYNEQRVGMYTDKELFARDQRDIHIGIDIAAPVGTPVFSFYDGEVFLFGVNSSEGDYGPTLITRHVINNKEIFALFGHLSAESLKNKSIGQKISKGQVIASVGTKSENGGWNPHLHFQLSWLRPAKPDMPGTVNRKDLDQALRDFPDPQIVLGRLY